MLKDGEYSIETKWQSALFQSGQCGAFVSRVLVGRWKLTCEGWCLPGGTRDEPPWLSMDYIVCLGDDERHYFHLLLREIQQQRHETH